VIFVVYGEQRLLEGASFDACEKVEKFGAGGQVKSSVAVTAQPPCAALCSVARIRSGIGFMP